MKQLLIMIAVFFLFSFRTNQEDKKFTIQLTVAEAQLIIGVIGQSDAKFSDRKAAMDLIVVPINKQIADTTKK